MQELGELIEAIESGGPERVWEEAADVANLAAMVAQAVEDGR